MAYIRIFMGDRLLEQRRLGNGRTTIGRTPDNDIVLNSHGVSKHHATIEKQGASYVLVDNNSANGVFVGGKRARRHTLSYWDEIQVFSFVLKFMAVPRLRGEEAGTADRTESGLTQDATMEVDISNLGDLAKLRNQIKMPALSMHDDSGAARHFALDKVNFRIGKSPDCDLRTPGWLAPRLAACIQRRNDGCYLLPGRRGRVSVNGHRVRSAHMLHDGDGLQIRGMSLTFFHRRQGGS